MADEIFMVTVLDDKGNEIVAYVKPDAKQAYVSMMSSEYGNVKIEGMSMADLPADVTFDQQ
jgi:hypothetical protein